MAKEALKKLIERREQEWRDLIGLQELYPEATRNEKQFNDIAMQRARWSAWNNACAILQNALEEVEIKINNN